MGREKREVGIKKHGRNEGKTRSSGKDSPTSLTLFNNTVSVVLFNYGKQCTLVFMVTVVKQ
jgi:hypothetical protein